MCGIFGYIHDDKIPELAAIKTDSILNHRGPDDHGWLISDGQNVRLGKNRLPNDLSAKIFLLHKRLSILDLSPLAFQPMVCDQQRYYLVFNGEIYNYLELRNELEKEGVLFFSKSDSEVLLKAYRHWGKECIHKLVGMFSFVIFDRLLKKFFIARDPFGVKPFYYYVDQQKIIFSSEISPVLKYVPAKKINSQSLYYYLRSGMTDFQTDTLFSGVQQLLAGHYLEIDLEQIANINIVNYWKPVINVNRDISFTEAASKLKNLFLNSLALQIRSDVPIAATLSGGIDSSSIVMALKHLYPSVTLNTFSYIAQDENLNEERWIDIINQQANCISHKVVADSQNLIADLEKLLAIQDEPFGSTSIYAQHCVFKAASQQGIKVMLDGQGADEMLGGYTFYIVARFVSLLKNYQFKEAARLLVIIKNNHGTRFLFQSLNYLLPSSWQLPLRKMANKQIVPNWLDASWFKVNGARLSSLKNNYGKSVLHEELLYTFSCSSLPMLLRYGDRNSMAYSIESRVPFLSRELVEFIFSLPENFIISEQGVSKSIFREAMRDIVPSAILERRDKIGFATPEKNWLSLLKPWVNQILNSDYAKSLPCFNHKALTSDWNNFLQGNAPFDFRFWRWINFIKWSEMHQVEF